MAFEQNLVTVTKPSGTHNLQAYQFYFVIDDGDGNVELVSNASQKGVLGVLQNDPLPPSSTGQTDGEVAEVAVGGVSKCVAGASVSPGDQIVTDAEGRGVPYSSGAGIVGIAMDSAAAAGDLFSLQLTPTGTP